jgi:hypothetical protein
MDAKDCVLFVHGFGSTPEKCWGRMMDLLRGDERITSRYDLEAFGYPTSWFETNVLGRIPALPELGRALAGKLQSSRYRGRTLTLVGHSQGGLVIFSYLQHQLSNGETTDLRPIRQAIFFATPFGGSTKGMSVRRIASKVITNPQELTLRVLHSDVAEMRSEVRKSVVNATRDGETSWRVPLHAFGGLQDDIVLEASARGDCESFKPLTGDHFSIVNPRDREDERYTELVDLLLDPGGHAHRFEIERYETIITIEPREPQTIHVPSKRNPREVGYSDYGTIRRTVRFSPNNRCKDVFTIKYATQADGYVVGHPSCHNEAPADVKGEAENRGTSYRFDFTPSAGHAYCLQVDLYNGFAEGNRDVHFHHTNDSHRRLMTYVLDLSKYVAAGYEIRVPRLFLDPTKTEHDELCDQRILVDPVPIDGEAPNGVYRWELREVREGVVDIIWEVSKVLPWTNL